MHRALLLLLLAGARLASAQVLGDVTIYYDNYTLDTFPDLPADFGPDVPDEGIDGLLRVADPEDACSTFSFTSTDEVWVALISRAQQLHPTNCTFDVKVRNAELAGASAAIIYDDTYEALIIMSKPRDHPEPSIPAVFVSEKAGIIMRKLITPGATRVRIVAVSASAWMSLVMSAFLGLMALAVVLATFYVMRSWSLWLNRAAHGRRLPADQGGSGAQGGGQEGLPARAIHALPVLVYEGKGRRRRSRSAGPLPDSLAASLATPDGAAAAAASASAAVPVPAASAAAAAWMSAATAADGSSSSGSGRIGQQPVAAAAAAPSDAAAAAAPAQPEQSPALPTAGLFWHQQQQQQQGGLFSPLLPITAPMIGGSSSLPARLPPSVGVAGHALSVAAPAAGPASPGHSDDSSHLLSTDEEEEEEEGEQPAAAAGHSAPVLASSSSSGMGQHCIITAGPVGARGGATRRTCVVCLERYQTGDAVRVLPCQHRFHAQCIDLWLATRRLCPVCKYDASRLPPAQLQPAVSLQSGAGSGAGAGAAVGGGGLAAAAAAALSAGPGSPSTTGGTAGLLFLGHRYWFAQVRSRLSRAGQQAQQAAAPHSAGSSTGVAAAGATEASNAQQQQTQPHWPHQQQQQRPSASSRPLLWLQTRQQQQRSGLGEPLIPAGVGGGSSGSSSSRGVPIPQLPSAQSDANAVDTHHCLPTAHSMV